MTHNGPASDVAALEPGLEAALTAALERRESTGRVPLQWLRRTFPAHAEDLRRALDLAGRLDLARTPGERLGPFRLKGLLGRGSMGSVHLAEVTRPTLGLPVGRVVAVKILHPHLSALPEVQERFRREARAGARVRHPGLVRTHGLARIARRGETHLLLAMDYVRGKSLRRLLDEAGPLPEAECRDVALQLTASLEGLHRRGVVHRDLKPQNVVRTARGRVRVLDLGLAWLQDELIRLSVSGQFVGSFLYAAPEQMVPRHGPLDGRADLYALGVTLFELAAGRLPWGLAPGPLATPSQDGLGPPRLLTVAPHLSPGFGEIVDRLLETSVEARFADAVAARRALQTLPAVPGPPDRRPAGEAAGGRTSALTRSRTRARGGRGLATLVAAMESARRGAGRALLLIGPSRAGLTRVADEWEQRIARGGLAVDVERFDDVDTASPPARARFVEFLDRIAGARAIALATAPTDGAGAWLDAQSLRASLSIVDVTEEVSDGAHDASPTPLAGIVAADLRLLARAARLGPEFDPAVLAKRMRRGYAPVLRSLTHLAREGGFLTWRGDRCAFADRDLWAALIARTDVRKTGPRRT